MLVLLTSRTGEERNWGTFTVSDVNTNRHSAFTREF